MSISPLSPAEVFRPSQNTTKVPLVVRLEGTNVDLGKKILRESGLDVIPADDLDDAAQKIVNAVRTRV